MDVLCDSSCNVSETSEDKINDFIDSRVFLMKWQMNIKSRWDEQSLAACQSLIAQPAVCSGTVVKSQCAVSCMAIEEPQVAHWETENSAWYLEVWWVLCVRVYLLDRSVSCHIHLCFQRRQKRCCISGSCDQGVQAWNRFFKLACFNINVTSIIYRRVELLCAASPKNPQEFALKQHAAQRTTPTGLFLLFHLIHSPITPVIPHYDNAMAIILWSRSDDVFYV